MYNEYLEAVQEAGTDVYLDPRIPRASSKRQRRNRRKAALAVVAILSLAVFSQRSYALFGVGDVVFDPSSYAVLGHIWSQDISNFAKLTATVTQLTKIFENGLKVYQLADEMRVAIQHPSSLIPIAYSTAGSITKTKFHETVDWSRVINSHASPEEIAAAWETATRKVPDDDMDTMREDDNYSARRADLATVQIVDGAAKACMENIGRYRGGNQLNELVRNVLKRYRLGDDNSMGQGSYMGQYQLMNIGGEHALNETVAANSLAVCETELKIADMKLRRDEAAGRLQTSIDYDKGKRTPSYNDPDASVDYLRAMVP